MRMPCRGFIVTAGFALVPDVVVALPADSSGTGQVSLWVPVWILGALILGFFLARWLGYASTLLARDLPTQEMLQHSMGRANIFLWSAKVRRKGERLEWAFKVLPESWSHPLVRLATKLGAGGLWDLDSMPDQKETHARVVKALEEGAPGYEQEFRIQGEDRLHWVREEVRIRRLGKQRWLLVGVVTEITTEVLALEANRRTSQQLRNILERVDCMPWQATVIQLEGGRLDWTFDVPPSVLQKRIFRNEGSLHTKRLYTRDFAVTQLPEMNRRGGEAILSGAAGYEQEFRLERLADGKVFWLHEHVSIVPEGNGRWQLYGLMVDMTSRHQALEARRESELQLQEVLMRVDCVLWHAQVQLGVSGEYAWRITALPSNLFYRLFECRPEDRSPALWEESMVPEYAELRERSHRAFDEGAAGYEQEFRFVRNGESTWLREQVTIHPEGQGRWHVVGVVIDVTARRRAEQALEAEKERLAVTLGAMEEGVVTVDLLGCVAFMNRAAEQLFRCRSSEVRGRLVEEVCAVVHASTGASLRLPLAEVFSRGETARFPAHCAVREAGGKVIELDGCCVPLCDARHELSGVVMVFRDMTDRHRLEQQLQRASKLETVGILAGGIAHDFNNILTAIMGNIGLALLEAGGSKELGAYLAEAQGASERARDLTQQLLTFSKGGDPVRSAVFLPEVIQEVVQFAVRGSKVRCEFDLPADLWPADADKGQVAQIIQNLAINSLQAMPGGGVLRLGARNEELGAHSRTGLAAGDYVCICVEDTGKGMPPEVLSRIFDPYFTTKKNGSGLGLATVFSIIKKHHGGIDVESEPGKGARFILRLPALRGAAAVAEKKSSPATRRLSGRVLVMDDEESIRRLQERMLQRLGLSVDLAADGAEAVTKYQAAWRAGMPYDLLVMDLTVPGGLGGAEALGAIRAINPQVKAIVASGYSSDPVMANYEAYGFCAMVAKPFDARNLTRVVAEVLQGGDQEDRSTRSSRPDRVGV